MKSFTEVTNLPFTLSEEIESLMHLVYVYSNIFMFRKALHNALP